MLLCVELGAGEEGVTVIHRDRVLELGLLLLCVEVSLSRHHCCLNFLKVCFSDFHVFQCSPFFVLRVLKPRMGSANSVCHRAKFLPRAALEFEQQTTGQHTAYAFAIIRYRLPVPKPA